MSIVGRRADLRIRVFAIFANIRTSVQEVAKMMVTASDLEFNLNQIYYSKLNAEEKRVAAESIIQETLNSLGYSAGVDVWEKILRTTNNE